MVKFFRFIFIVIYFTRYRVIDRLFPAINNYALYRYCRFLVGLGVRTQSLKTIDYYFYQLGPLWVKVGQNLSMRSDLIAQQALEELTWLQDQVPPEPKSLSIATLEKAFGKPHTAIFKSIGDCIGGGSIAQVYDAELITGEKVCVKILRHNIQHKLKKDLSVLQFMLNAIQPFLNNKTIMASLYEHISQIIYNETDLSLEAAAMVEFQAMQESIYTHYYKFPHTIHTPKVYWDYTLDSVLTMEKIEGKLLKDCLNDPQLPFDSLAHTLAQNFLYGVLYFGYFHSDLHQGNILIGKDYQIYIIDFGQTGRLDQFNRNLLANIIYGFLYRDYEKIATTLIDSGLINKDQFSVYQVAQAYRAIGEPIYNKKGSEISFFYLLKKNIETIRRFNIIPQVQLMILQKSLALIESNALTLHPHINMWNVFKPVMSEWLKNQKNPFRDFPNNIFNWADFLFILRYYFKHRDYAILHSILQLFTRKS